MMLLERSLCFLFFLILTFEQIVAPPAVIKNKHNDDKDEAIKTNEVEPDMMTNADFDVEYKRYLQEVVKILDTDEEFKKKIQDTSVEDLNTGKLAKELDMVNHHVRSKLDELKRQEVQRLRDVVKQKMDLGHGPLHPSEYEHIDHLNLDTFEVKDLDNLLKKVSKDMEKLDEMRRQQFKQYEMEKHFQDEVKMKNMTDKEKDEYKEHLEEMKEKHANHEKIHHPGSKAQFEEVWEKQDHLENQDFDPKVFFHLHDIDGNGYWDPEEVKVLFIKELDKMYQAGLPEDDMKERQEEMERMREHVFNEMDKNGDNLISFQEYMEKTKSKEFAQDDGWDTIDKQKIYSQEEYARFEQRRMAELQDLMNRGLIPPDQYPGIYHSGPAYPVHPNQQYHPNQVPQYHPNQVPPQGYHPNQAPQHPNQYPNQMPPQQQYQNNQQAYQQNQHPNQIPQQDYHPNPPPGYHSAGQPNQNSQQQYPNSQNNQQQQYPTNQNSQQQYQQNTNNNQQQYQQQPYQQNNQPQQQYQQNNQPQQQYQQNNHPQQQYQQNNQPQYQQNNQPQHNSNKNDNQQHYQQANQNGQQNNQAGQPSNVQPPSSNH